MSVSFTIDPDRLAEADRRIAAANRRLTRNGIAERFTYTTTTAWVNREINGVRVRREEATLTLETPRIGYSGWTFVARMEKEEAGMVVHTAPGQSLAGWKRPDDTWCDHCRMDRDRLKVFILRNDDTGELKQVGGTCLNLFLGIAPAGLWALGFHDDLRGDFFPEHDDEEAWERARAGGRITVPLREVIALALAASDRGRRYVSRDSAYMATPTADVVKTLLFAAKVPPDLVAVKDDRDRLLVERPGLVDEVLASVDSVNPDSDYGMNVRAVAESEWIGERSIGLAASLVAVWARETQRRVEAEQQTRGFLADVGETLRDVSATVTLARGDSGFYGPTTLLVMKAEGTGHVLKWFASKDVDVEAGDLVRIKSAKVKEHAEYKGTDQTILTRVRLEKLPALVAA
ncbi:hypothetical protein IU485_27875 [Nocardia cyriacigeorgica]|uniref:hypothetical protein n=1 Tax=Nocardia cyriacigeorgica TaxID=135487 RepID=UPI001894999F|nr:hypothetical protein [Nocardia cyriacigeorgica]MBF6085197.1 hypothetical protein [Nocardia cyriacigeorgica]